MMRKKKGFSCVRCSSKCEIYKKGKHRLLVCPNCGIIASNPLPLAALAAMALPSVIGAVSGGGKDDKITSQAATQKIITDSLDKPNKGERYVKMALGG